MNRKILGILVMILLIGIVFPLVSGENTVSLNTIIVPDDYSTIQKAISNANSGDTIYVRAGTYYENLIVDKSVTLEGENRDTTIIDGGGNGDVIRVAADYITITGFTITNSGNNKITRTGVKLWASYANISGNIISYNFAGIWGQETKSNIICDNIFIEDGVQFEGTLKSCFDHVIVNNTVNGKPLLYYKDKDDFTVPSDCGQILLFNCDNVLISDISIDHTDWGVLLAWCDECTIQNLNISNNNGDGIVLINSNNNIVKDNNLLSNNMIGITSSLSSYNLIKDNTITGDTWVGISLTVSDNCQVLDNNIVLDYTIRNSDYPCTGIWLYAYCYENRIISNIISSCDNGISISSSNSNIFEKNYITGCHVFNTFSQLIDNNYLISAEDEIGTIIPIKTRGIGIFLEDAIANEFRFNNVLENDINLVLFSSYFNKIRFNNIEDSTTGIDCICLFSPGWFPFNYWGSSITGPIFKSNKLFCFVPWSPTPIVP